MIRILIMILIGFIGYSLVQALLRPKQKQDCKMPRNRSRAGEQMVEDPHCGTFIPLSDAVTAQIGGKSHHFCSKKCLKEYKKKHK